MTQLTLLRALYDYNWWANARTLEACGRVSPEAFQREIGGSFESLRGTLAHLYGAEWLWLERFRGVSPRTLPSPAEFPDVDSIGRRWAQVERGQREHLDGLDQDALDAPLSYVNMRGETWTYPLGRAMWHVVNHSTYHRGQIATLLRQLGAEPLSTDLLLYDDLVGETE